MIEQVIVYKEDFEGMRVRIISLEKYIEQLEIVGEISYKALEAIENQGAEQPEDDTSAEMFRLAHDALKELDEYYTKLKKE